MHGLKDLVVWKAIFDDGIIGPYVHENSFNVNSDCYYDTLQSFLGPEQLKNVVPTDYHASDQPITAVIDLFPNKVISGRGNVYWLPKLSRLPVFIWGYLKSKVYENNPTN